MLSKKFKVRGLIKSVNGKSPQLGEDCYIAENATIVGDVVCGNQCSFGLMQLFVAMCITSKWEIK